MIRTLLILVLGCTSTGCVTLPTHSDKKVGEKSAAAPRPVIKPGDQVTPAQVNESSAHDIARKLAKELDDEGRPSK